MKKLIALALAAALTASLVGCRTASTGDDRIVMPASSGDFKGENYQDVITQLETAGFTSIETTMVADLIVGWLTQDGEVERVSVNGETDFTVNSKFPSDARIIVTYHTFPETESEETTESSSAPEEPAPQAKPNSDLNKRTKKAVLEAFGVNEFIKLYGEKGMDDSLIPYISSMETVGGNTVKVTLQVTKNDVTREELDDTARVILSLSGEKVKDLDRVEVWTADNVLHGISNRWEVPLLNR